MDDALAAKGFCQYERQLEFLFFKNMQRVDPCHNPPAQEADKHVCTTRRIVFYYITGFTGLTYSE